MLSSGADIISRRLTRFNTSAYIRKLNAKDEAQFIKLLYAVYKDTYSYTILYEPI